jgi:hypothetical protein
MSGRARALCGGVALLLVAGLAACGDDDVAAEGRGGGPVATEAPPDSTTESTMSAEQEAAFMEELTDTAYVDVVTQEAPSLERLSDEELIAIAANVCNNFDGGATWDGNLAQGVDAGFTADESEVLAVYAVLSYCGDHRTLVPGYNPYGES